MKSSYAMQREEMFSTAQLAKRLGFNPSVSFLKSCGVSPLTEQSQGVYWRKSDFPLICRAISKKLEEIAKDYA